MIVISAYGEPSFCHKWSINILRQISLDWAWFDTCPLKILCLAMSEHDQVYCGWIQNLCCQNCVKMKEIILFELPNSKLIFYHIWLILYILKQVIQMAHKQNSSSVFAHSYTFSDFELYCITIIEWKIGQRGSNFQGPTGTSSGADINSTQPDSWLWSWACSKTCMCTPSVTTKYQQAFHLNRNFQVGTA